jgi:hypothetical protein
LEKRIESLLTQVPGYTGYRGREDRRDDDRRLRESIAGSLDRTVSTLTRVGATLAEQRKLAQISMIERLVGTTRLLGDRVRTATYGYGGIFTERSVDEFALDQLRQFDHSFQQETASLDELANRIANSPEGPLDVDLAAYQNELNRLGQLFDARSAVVDTARPNRDASVLAMLEPPVEETPSPLAALRIGDALSILGDNYLVDATITFSEPDRQVTLARVGEGEDGAAQWLIGGTTADIPSAKLSEQSAGAVSTASGRAAQAVVATGSQAKEGVGAQYAYTANAGETVTFWYSIGGETRSFAGTVVEDADIEVYGQA